MLSHWYTWKSTAALSFCFGTDWVNAMLLLAFTALKDGIRRSGFRFDIALHESIYALLGCNRYRLGLYPCHFLGVEVEFRALADAQYQKFDWNCRVGRHWPAIV